MDTTYQNALRLGERCYNEQISKGEDPYLPVLEDLTAGSNGMSEQALGLQEIPLDQIVGTYSEGRKTAFASNFMPLMDDSTEFAWKYQSLINAHLNEGIRDPIKCYEYLHRYYVVEGNKRVSVLKFFNAVSVPGEVTRIIPAHSDDLKIRVYYEFLSFYRIVPVNYLDFSKPGDYDRFLTLTGFSADNPPTEKDLRQIKSSYVRFQSAYRAMGGNRLSGLTESDAYLICIGIYGFDAINDALPDQMKKDIEKIWDEFELSTKEETVKLVTDDEEAKKKSLLDRLFSVEKVLNVSFIYEKTPETLSWTYGHELGRQHVNEAFRDKIVTKAYENADDHNIEALIEEAVKDKADVIFVTSSRFLQVCLKEAVTHPEVRILCCALNYPHRYLRTYYARTYEAKFVSGVIAGAMAGESDIGYVANCPILSNILNLNAFANGVKMVNPRAKVHVVWTDEIGADPRVTFWNEGISIISGRELLAPSEEFHREFGLYRYTEDHEVESLAMTLWNWGAIYQRIIESIRSGSFEDVDKKSGHRALNYFWGFDTGAIDLLINKNVPEGVSRLARFLSSSVKNGELAPFYGVLHSENEILSPAIHSVRVLKDLKKTGWLMDNIEGHIPRTQDLRESVRELVETQGVKSLEGIGGDA